MDVIIAERLSRRFGRVEAVKSIDLAVRQGECLGLLGHNGAGKTTTIKLLLGLIRPTSGRAILFGKPAGDPAVKARVGYSPETPHFYPFLTARESLDFFRKLGGWRPGQVDLDGILAAVGLATAAKSRVGGFSKGMVQRLAVAQALVGDPAVLFLDEPSSGLDPAGRIEMRELVCRLKAEGRTIFLNTHIVSDLEEVADRVAIMKRGRLAAVEPLHAVGGGVVARVRDLSPETLDALRQQGVKAAYQGDRLTLAGVKPGQEPAVVARLVAGGAQVYSFAPQTAGLEERFMTIMEGGHAHAAGAGS